MNQNLAATKITPTVKSLVETIRLEIKNGKERAQQAMEQEKRFTYWNVGKHIKQHLMQNSNRAGYGDYLIPQLSEELDLAATLLYDSVQFYQQYPTKSKINGKLSWTHIRTLLVIPQQQERQELETKIVKENLSVRDLKKLVKDIRPLQIKAKKTILRTTRGQPYIYRLKKIQGKTMIDLGFRIYCANPCEESMCEQSSKTHVFQTDKVNQNYQVTNMGRGEDPHYTYKAHVLKVIDGDTIWVNIDLGFDNWTTQKIRLKGINTKELDTAEGQNAKQYIENRFKQCEFIVIKTYWRDKFTRYLADIFYIKKETDLNTVVQQGTFLNQELLDEWLAVKY